MTTSRPADAAGTPLPADLVEPLVAAVCRPADVPAVRRAVLERDPQDLAGLVAAVDHHQPMTLEVVVDVLAELDVPPAAIATAMAIDIEDVLALLTGPLGARPSTIPDHGARVIDVPTGTSADPVDQLPAQPLDQPPDQPIDQPSDQSIDQVDDQPIDQPPDQSIDHADDPPPEGQPDDGAEVTEVGPDDEPVEVASAGAPPVVRIDEVAEDESVARTVADLEGEVAGPGRARLVWALVLFVLVAGGIAAAALLWPT